MISVGMVSHISRNNQELSGSCADFPSGAATSSVATAYNNGGESGQMRDRQRRPALHRVLAAVRVRMRAWPREMRSDIGVDA